MEAKKKEQLYFHGTHHRHVVAVIVLAKLFQFYAEFALTDLSFVLPSEVKIKYVSLSALKNTRNYRLVTKRFNQFIWRRSHCLFLIFFLCVFLSIWQSAYVYLIIHLSFSFYKRVYPTVRPSVRSSVKFLGNRLNMNKIASGTWNCGIEKPI